jgi:phenylacetate-CoA ligase
VTKNRQLAAQVHYAYTHAPAVRRLFDQTGLSPKDIQTVDDLRRVPITTKDMMIQYQEHDPPFGGWLAVPLHQVATIWLSPGPLFDAHDDSTHNNSAKVLSFLGYVPGDLVINCFAYHMVPAGLLFHEGLLRCGVTVLPMGPGNTQTQVEVILRLGVNGYIGTPSFLAMILDEAARQGIGPKALPLNKALMTGEYYPPSLRARFENEYGILTAQCYATADFGVIAYEVYGEEGMTWSDDLIVELLDPASGEPVLPGTPGEVVVTNFSQVYPLIRFGTGDMAIAIPETNQLRALVGRTGEAVKVRGMFVHPNQLNLALAQFPAISQWEAQVSREDSRDLLHLQIEVTDPRLDLEMVSGMVKNIVHLSINTIEIVDKVQEPRRIKDLRAWR